MERLKRKSARKKARRLMRSQRSLLTSLKARRRK